MMRPQSKRGLNVSLLLVVLLTTVLIGMTARTAEAQVESRKSPWLAFGLSYMLPGGGQAYNGQWAKAGLMVGGEVASIVVFATNGEDCLSGSSFGGDCGLAWAGFLAGAWIRIWSMIDAPVTANAINRRIEAGEVALEIGPQLIMPQSRSAMGSLRPSGFPSFQRNSRIDLSLVRVRF